MRLLVSAAAALALAFPLTASASAATTTVEVGADYVFESTEEADTSMETFATRCKKVSAQYTRTNGAFNDLYKVGQRWGFCWSTVTHKITSLYGWERWKQCCDPGWSWVSWEPTTTAQERRPRARAHEGGAGPRRPRTSRERTGTSLKPAPRSARKRAPRRSSRAAWGDAPFGQRRVGHVGGRGDQAAHSPRDVEAHIRARGVVQPENAPGSLIDRPRLV